MVAARSISYGERMANLALTLGRNLRKLRGSLTQEEFEERTGISQSHLSELERGKGWAQIQGLADRLTKAGIDPSSLLAPGPVEIDPAVREACDLLARAPQAVRQGVLLILREAAAGEEVAGA